MRGNSPTAGMRCAWGEASNGYTRGAEYPGVPLSAGRRDCCREARFVYMRARPHGTA